MLIISDFFLLNYPKTGTTFTRRIIKTIYKNKYEELPLPVILDRIFPHEIYPQIPLERQGNKAVSVIQNPFDRYMFLQK